MGAALSAVSRSPARQLSKTVARYTVTAWHEGAKNSSKPVTVAGEGKADFTLSK